MIVIIMANLIAMLINEFFDTKKNCQYPLALSRVGTVEVY